MVNQSERQSVTALNVKREPEAFSESRLDLIKSKFLSAVILSNTLVSVIQVMKSPTLFALGAARQCHSNSVPPEISLSYLSVFSKSRIFRPQVSLFTKKGNTAGSNLTARWNITINRMRY